MTDLSKGPSFSVIGGITDKRRVLVPELQNPKLIEHSELQGTRLIWQRYAQCPCVGINDQTEQPDPNCELCGGDAIFHFGPENYEIPDEAGEFDEVQQATIDATGGAIISAIIARSTSTQELFDKFGNWVEGALYVTTRPENKIAYYDRLTALDSVVCFSEVVEVGSDFSIPLRYKARAVNLFRSLSTTWKQGEDFYLTDGVVEWAPAATPPAAETRVTVHYETHPTYLVTSHPHVFRAAQSRRKSGGKRQPVEVSIQAQIRLEYVPPAQ